ASKRMSESTGREAKTIHRLLEMGVSDEGKSFYNDLVSYITSAPVVAMVWQLDDEDCVQLVRKVVGATKPSEALPGTIRGDFCSHTNHNIIHASDSDESAEREINLFFKPEELIDWKDEASCWF
ncbi:nucleoside-diphosphate kinase, partial [Treponema sp.]|uniref:nucleoside-diphosphate kinase n=1 Tax=Treponema sp. TaxID=166 RepID=UPI00388DF782